MKMILIEECTNCKEDVQFKVDFTVNICFQDSSDVKQVSIISIKDDLYKTKCKNCNAQQELFV